LGIFGFAADEAFSGGRGFAGEDHRGEALILAGRGHHWGLACVTRHANALALLVRLRNVWVRRKYICEIRDGFELPHTLHNDDVVLGV